jgi:hypothetical protein
MRSLLFIFTVYRSKMSRVTSIQYIIYVDSTDHKSYDFHVHGREYQRMWKLSHKKKINQILAKPYLAVRSLHLREDCHDGTDQMKESHG